VEVLIVVGVFALEGEEVVEEYGRHEFKYLYLVGGNSGCCMIGEEDVCRSIGSSENPPTRLMKLVGC